MTTTQQRCTCSPVPWTRIDPEPTPDQDCPQHGDVRILGACAPVTDHPEAPCGHAMENAHLRADNRAAHASEAILQQQINAQACELDRLRAELEATVDKRCTCALSEGPAEDCSEHGNPALWYDPVEHCRLLGEQNARLLADLATARENAPLVALPASWDCAHGASEDEPFCAEAEDDSHACPIIRVHPDDAEAFAALVTRIHQLKTPVETR